MELSLFIQTYENNYEKSINDVFSNTYWLFLPNLSSLGGARGWDDNTGLGQFHIIAGALRGASSCEGEFDVLQHYPTTWHVLAAVELHGHRSGTCPGDVLVRHPAYCHGRVLHVYGSNDQRTIERREKGG